jgi:hypothetical protein
VKGHSRRNWENSSAAKANWGATTRLVKWSAKRLRFLEEHDSARAARLTEFNSEAAGVNKYVLASVPPDRQTFRYCAKYPALDTGATITAYPVLFWTVDAYLILYRAEQRRPVETVAATRGSRDIPHL